MPIKSPKALFEWNEEDSQHNCALKKLKTSKQELISIVCHDYKGGYLEDKYSHGTNEFNEWPPYSLNSWCLIDIFIYFSHNLVTIPPPGWINAAHKNQTLILGTFIVEWEDGRKMLDEILKDDINIEKSVDMLVKLCNYYGFDGWLINIESKVQEDTVVKLQTFLKMLTQKMHISKTFSKIIWYDSIISNGNLEWQNELNDLNNCFLKYSDAIFLNYTWTEANLNNSMKDNKKVFVGIDVFGRGCNSCHGEGGFNTIQAVKQARSRNLGCAIFAPGWTLETLGGEKFDYNNDRFWSLLENDLNKNIEVEIPFYTNFCKGYGKKWYVNGKLEQEKKFFNLSLQSPQPYEYTNLTDGTIFCGSNSFRVTNCHDLFDINTELTSAQVFVLEFAFVEQIELKLYEKDNRTREIETFKKSSSEEECQYDRRWKIKRIEFQTKSNHQKLILVCSGSGFLGYIHFYEKSKHIKNTIEVIERCKNWTSFGGHYIFNGNFNCTTLNDLSHFNIYIRNDKESEWKYNTSFYGSSFEITQLKLDKKQFYLKISSIPGNYSTEIYIE
ncbi:DgyrCDS1964 [Dimorphilus gyrociliatus]|uniref:DgyrCDS1964 n=1 Tax=Dimorphilus gyrociliatus TaxID=2664684 RepID=A0A7I8VBZ0_9ANNE|nr:DgyrCDS1964 [Dimorphilus gyrociliatus]